jgi:hypothetical protein
LDPSSSQPVTLPIIFSTRSPNYVLRFSKFAPLNYSALLFWRNAHERLAAR